MSIAGRLSENSRQGEPKDIWFRYPIHEQDLSGMLEDSNPKRAGGSAGWHREHGRRALGEIEAALDGFMGDRDEVPRKDFVDYVGRDKRTVDKYVAQSSLFEIETGVSSATIRRVGGRGVT